MKKLEITDLFGYYDELIQIKESEEKPIDKCFLYKGQNGLFEFGFEFELDHGHFVMIFIPGYISSSSFNDTLEKARFRKNTHTLINLKPETLRIMRENLYWHLPTRFEVELAKMIFYLKKENLAWDKTSSALIEYNIYKDIMKKMISKGIWTTDVTDPEEQKELFETDFVKAINNIFDWRFLEYFVDEKGKAKSDLHHEFRSKSIMAESRWVNIKKGIIETNFSFFASKEWIRIREEKTAVKERIHSTN